MNRLILKKMKSNFLIFLLVILGSQNLIADDWTVILDLKGDWKFNIGDDERWSEYDFDDRNWDQIYVPSSWEDEGYYNYNGYAWYRKEFRLSKKLDHKIIYLSLGYIDDVDEVYLNGKLVGSTGTFPPNFGTAYNAIRRYPVPIDYFHTNRENVIAVKVYDSRLGGGITSGDISLMIMESMYFEISLEGFWKFKTGDNPEYKESDFDDNEWNDILVPSKWEVSGYPEGRWTRRTDQVNGQRYVVFDVDDAYFHDGGEGSG
ncbi:MAG: beta galactosidase jelly roll domain-containing protein, partial [Melioribacteraceae bacterium]|nr:beta galactosidase jelly roll domain-containing protein [Melioribacteraceae bacterium]